ncbi:class I SAM-dependent methyltransferase [Pseudooceanicola onchidii]|uniref:class I SAM-dependent methyltransferase n=1 Tax=Pseudooceanicola onchidii TaxID=2562279 RepID=UPI0010AAD95D|nr:class I SAM-dependent methyltransferase [Pseudooceanicola onchidii]
MTGHPRLDLALAPGGLTLPEGRIAVFGPREGTSLDPLPKDRVEVITTLFPDHAWFDRQGYACRLAPDGTYAAAVVFLPRAKALARDWIARARAATSGPVIVDGGKEDGIEGVLKDCRKRTQVSGPVNKAHGKLFWFEGGDFTEWLARPAAGLDGFVTAPGVFSADGIDPASALLAEALPRSLGAHVVDLGAGWGYLGAQVLERTDVTRLDMIEADHAALDCARQNVTDPRALFHWADATAWTPEVRADAVVMNPPFHTGRKPQPDLGRAFIRTAAACLKPKGTLWMVANRHLPYEAQIEDCFATHEEVAGTGRFKVLRATGPRVAKSPRLIRRDRLG